MIDIVKSLKRQNISSTIVDGKPVIKNGATFKPLKESVLISINDSIQAEMQARMTRANSGRKLDTLTDVKARSAQFADYIRTNINQGSAQTVYDTAIHRDIATPVGATTAYGLQNPLWIAPSEAATIYSAKGIPELIIDKKSNSIRLNGISILNKKLSAKQIDKIRDEMLRYQLPTKIAEAMRDSLVYGGSLVFPVFKHDTPASMYMSVPQLLKYGILQKGSLTRFEILDRWNVVFTPDWNPVNATFNNPDYFFVPFLGSAVSATRCARIITSPPAGYWGVLMTLGWGVSDIPSWIEAVYNYENVMHSVPQMIKQMSILTRSVDAQALSAMEGLGLLEREAHNNSRQLENMDPGTILTADTIGELKAVQRDFDKVPELIRIIRQDIAAKARYPEELIWSSEKAAFTSDNSDSAFEKQTENVRYVHLKVADQLKNLIAIFVINALGPTRDVMEALPYTSIEFDNPKLTNAVAKSEIAGKVAKGAFDLTASGLPVAVAVQIVQQLCDYEFTLDTATLDELNRRQAEADEVKKQTDELDIALKQAQLKQMELQAQAIATAPAQPASSKNVAKVNKTGAYEAGHSESVQANENTSSSGGHSYSSRLEQKQHEKIKAGGRQQQGLQKQVNKKR